MTTKLELPIKKCIILYSRRHFDPNSSTPLENSSAGIIARNLYEEMKSRPDYQVYYFDSFDTTEWLKLKADLLISIIDNLSLGIWFFDPKEIIVIAVNQHPLERFSICGTAARDGIPTSAISPSDGIYQTNKSLTQAKAIICVGNNRTRETFGLYLKNANVILATYQTSFTKSIQKLDKNKIENILILMSSIGFRKGFDRIFQSLNNQKELLKHYNFHLIGHSEGPYWDNQIEFLKTHFVNFTYHGWLYNSDEQFRSLLASMDLALFPTREEGLVGSLLECIDLGILSLHTISSGLDNSTKELRLASKGDLDLAGHLKLLDSMDKSKLSQLRERQQTDMNLQFSLTLPIELALRIAVESEMPEMKMKLRISRLISVYFNFPYIRYRKLIFNRFRLTHLRHFLMKLSLEKPALYKNLRTFYRNIR